MARKEIFIILSAIFLVGLLLWYLFIYQPQKLEAKQLELQLTELQNKLQNANQANLDIENVEQRLLEEKDRVQEIKLRFIEKNDLAKVSNEVRILAKNHKLKLTDFAPVLENYFADTVNAKISALPLIIIVQGKFLNIGKFIEDWEQLPFYLTPHEISISRIKAQSNELETRIMCKIYAWNN